MKKEDKEITDRFLENFKKFKSSNPGYPYYPLGNIGDTQLDVIGCIKADGTLVKISYRPN